MILKPQDVVILLKLISLKSQAWTYAELAKALFMSVSEVHGGLKRAANAKLIHLNTAHPLYKKPNRKALLEFLVHGVKYAYPSEFGRITRGIPTAYAAPPLQQLIVQNEEYPPVWFDAESDIQGYEVLPLYKSVPPAAKLDEELYKLLALLDAIRIGRAREKQLAIQELTKRLTSG
jgi:hypothetical protein